MFDTGSDFESPMMTPPSPNNKLLYSCVSSQCQPPPMQRIGHPLNYATPTNSAATQQLLWLMIVHHSNRGEGYSSVSGISSINSVTGTFKARAIFVSVVVVTSLVG